MAESVGCGPAVYLEPEKSARKRQGGWLVHRMDDGQEVRVIALRRAYRVLHEWLTRAQATPDQPCRLSLEEVALAVPDSVAAEDARAGKRVGFGTVHGIMVAVRRVLTKAKLKMPRAMVEDCAYLFPPLRPAMECCNSARH